MYLVSQEEREARGVYMLPRTSDEAVRAFSADSLSQQVFGPVIFNSWVVYQKAK